ncbi:desiccation-related protein PCC13-62-like [Iris pallida]|uniref:Desiccation-related protein PCC13-62-like n=1 Tax=Iris pallida TaxID=29817 RepID=A0AAX6FLZ6_IRIPA|nr:desiccation-related protein PCC13-62-like [Iris pallida]KAJ6847743.1 desiccation-related protein PCC13-62-like [Iris pallida]
MQFALNLEHTETEWFLFGALGYGLDNVEPELAMGGPPPVGTRKARLDNVTRRIIEEFGYQEVGHLRAIKKTVGGFPRPLINLSKHNFEQIFDEAFGYSLSPPFDPYIDSLNYLLASYVIPYVGLVAYVGTNPNIEGYVTKRLLAGLLAVEAGQDAVIRALLYERAKETVPPYDITVAEFTDRISDLRNRLAMCGVRDEGLIVPLELGAEQRTTSNILSADRNSLGMVGPPRRCSGLCTEPEMSTFRAASCPLEETGSLLENYLGTAETDQQLHSSLYNIINLLYPIIWYISTWFGVREQQLAQRGRRSFESSLGIYQVEEKNTSKNK